MTATSSSVLNLDLMRAPDKSDLARKRKIDKPKTTGLDNKPLAQNQIDTKSVCIADHVEQFPGECFETQHRKLFCVACCEELSLIKSTIKCHIYPGNKHKDADNRLAKGEARDHDIAHSSMVYDKTTAWYVSVHGREGALSQGD